MHFTATFRANPPPQAAGTQFFAMDVDEVPVAGSRPDRLVDVRPQERVQRRTVEQLVEPVSGGTGSRCSCAADAGTGGG